MLKTKMTRLSLEQALQIKDQLGLRKWVLDPRHFLEREYTFQNFEDTWAFLTKVALRAHLCGHHPKITTLYNKVTIHLTTHDAQGITQLDFKFAERCERYANRIGLKDIG
ncbi:hypothetical protein KL930_002744 [Ogataea haglerorum]|uniref:4a-hydroxytetrahydrobiopterin dehydratase n=1 Tax=Ogataea haglerorum TaxID=1937702 RepID=A0AAN6D900_9ASCO|nr:hypothetical protein KL915_002069 [Ogataea haglerorum]KAG7697504.1 hypothetical protein KL951_002866 [Ogataea haglerorum]KAG7707478.1 hypothetical protein KL914_002299 [Ogataea haglerorum]KAG7709514.1 hypothetical protein KL950_001733 [Ogataea haglerorum]KAG7719592.1 hypothetical protein KL913_001561 [Ogataea haglerorum]